MLPASACTERQELTRQASVHAVRAYVTHGTELVISGEISTIGTFVPGSRVYAIFAVSRSRGTGTNSGARTVVTLDHAVLAQVAQSTTTIEARSDPAANARGSA